MTSIPNEYRPQLFSQMVGQQRTVSHIQALLKQNSVPSFIILSGKHGSGKTTAALLLAQALNCQHSDTQIEDFNGTTSIPAVEPCGTCASCTEIRKNTSLSVRLIDAASNNGVDFVRSLTESIQVHAVGRYKVIILDECHRLTGAAQAALLTTLESPPDNVVFIFCTTEPEQLSDTIRSRADHNRLNPVPADEILQNLKQIVKDKQIKIDPTALRMMAHHANGSVRDAQSLLGTLSTIEGGISLDDFFNAIGLSNPVALVSLVRQMELGNYYEAMVERRGKFQATDPKSLAPTLLKVYSDILTFASTKDSTVCLLPEADLSALSALVPLDVCVERLDYINRRCVELTRDYDPGVSVDSMIVAIAVDAANRYTGEEWRGWQAVRVYLPETTAKFLDDHGMYGTLDGKVLSTGELRSLPDKKEKKLLDMLYTAYQLAGFELPRNRFSYGGQDVS